jgi:hypothetical protein
MMPIVSLDKAQVGMRLSKPVANESGVVLLEAGTTLTSQLITGLLNANITSVCIAGTPDRARMEEMLSGLRKRFEKSRHEAHMAMLEELVAEHIEELYAQ